MGGSGRENPNVCAAYFFDEALEGSSGGGCQDVRGDAAWFSIVYPLRHPVAPTYDSTVKNKDKRWSFRFRASAPSFQDLMYEALLIDAYDSDNQSHMRASGKRRIPFDSRTDDDQREGVRRETLSRKRCPCNRCSTLPSCNMKQSAPLAFVASICCGRCRIRGDRTHANERLLGHKKTRP